MQQGQDKKRLATLTLAALGIVYGDTPKEGEISRTQKGTQIRLN